jgi:hypothetical protein
MPKPRLHADGATRARAWREHRRAAAAAARSVAVMEPAAGEARQLDSLDPSTSGPAAPGL